MYDLSVVIPAYNEEKRIAPTLKSIGKYFAQSDIKCEVIVVVNNTTDNTVGIVNKISKSYPFIKVLDIKGYTGKGGAIARGVKMAKGKYIAYQDADGSSHVEDLIKGYHRMLNSTNLDIVMGSRYIKGAHISGELPAYRFIFSRLFNFAVRTIFQLNFADTQCAVKVMKKQVAKKLLKNLTAKKWTVDVNLLIDGRFNNYNVLEYPINWIYKDGSKLNVKSAMFEVSQELISLKIYQTRKTFGLLINSIKNTIYQTIPLR